MRVHTVWKVIAAATVTAIVAACGSTPSGEQNVAPPNGKTSLVAFDFSDKLHYASQMSMKQGVNDFLVTFRTSDVYPVNTALTLTNGQARFGTGVELGDCSAGAKHAQIDPDSDAIIGFDFTVENLSNKPDASSVEFIWNYDRSGLVPVEVPILTVYNSNGSLECDHEMLDHESLDDEHGGFADNYGALKPGTKERSAGFFVLKGFYSDQTPDGDFAAIQDILVGYDRFVVGGSTWLIPIEHSGFKAADAYPGYYTRIKNGTYLVNKRVDRGLAKKS